MIVTKSFLYLHNTIKLVQVSFDDAGRRFFNSVPVRLEFAESLVKKGNVEL